MSMDGTVVPHEQRKLCVSSSTLPDRCPLDARERRKHLPPRKLDIPAPRHRLSRDERSSATIRDEGMPLLHI